MKPLGWILLAACAVQGADIRSVDFKNGLYRPSCRDRKPLVVKDGVYQREDERFGFRVLSVQFGDLTGDGNEEAVVLAACRLGGSGNPTEGYIFTMKSSKASQVARVPMGDRASGGIEKLEMEGGMLKVTRKQGEAACCAERLETTTYKLEGARLVQVGDVVVRKYEGK